MSPGRQKGVQKKVVITGHVMKIGQGHPKGDSNIDLAVHTAL